MLSKWVILLSVEFQLKNDDQKFPKLCSILKRFPATLQIAEEMNQTFERCDTYSDAMPAEGKISYVECVNFACSLLRSCS